MVRDHFVCISSIGGLGTDGLTFTSGSRATAKKYTDTSVSYRSSDTSVATVSKSGSMHVNKGVAAGKTATVYVESADGRQKASIRITVK
ncbi:MAG: Ig-like domain-containing protein [Lachnospiraceae bacterium]|nr:Ig-like domain-containing protein [Lachnospiraceae bacterium]